MKITLNLKPMAIIQNFINTKDKEKVGNVQCYKRWGKNVLRTVPYNPNSPAQKTNRSRMKKLSPLIHQVIDHINIAYEGLIHGKGNSAFNHLVGININCCFIKNTSTIDPGLFVLSDNDGSFIDNVVLSSTVANTITATFNSNAQNDDEATDPVRVYGFHVEENKMWLFNQVATRSTGTITLTRCDMSGLNIAVYIECLDRVNLLMDNPRHIIKYVGTVIVI
jgi:hypothetical protein